MKARRESASYAASAMTWPTPCKPYRSVSACGRSPYCLGAGRMRSGSRSHRRPRGVWSSIRYANDRWPQFQPPFYAHRISVDFQNRAYRPRYETASPRRPHATSAENKSGLAYLPKTSVRSRRWAALPAIHKITSTNRRLSTPLRPGSPTRPGRWFLIQFHCSFVSVRLLKAHRPWTALNQNFNLSGTHKCRQALEQK